MKTPTALFPLSLWAIAVCLPSLTSAWQLGNNERVMWSMHCGFADASSNQGVLDATSERGDRCAEDSSRAHWTWKEKSETISDDTCFLKGGTTDEANHRDDAHCGYVIGQFDGAIDPNDIKPPTKGGPQTISSSNGKPNDSVPNPNAQPVELNSSGKVSDWALGSDGRVKWSSNCEISGEDIQSVPGKASVCGDACADNESCTHWTWKPDSQSAGTCFLRSGAFGDATPLKGAGCGYVLGRPATPSGPSSGEDKPAGSDCDCYGSDIGNKFTPQSTDCAAACEENPSCTHWTWISQDEKCFLKTAGKPYATILSGARCGCIASRVSGTPNTPTEFSPSQKEVPGNANGNSSPGTGGNGNGATSTTTANAGGTQGSNANANDATGPTASGNQANTGKGNNGANANASGGQGNTVSTVDGTGDGNLSINNQLDTKGVTESDNQAPQDTGFAASESEAMLGQINQVREARGLAPVVFNELLAAAARKQSLYQASKSALTDSDGGDVTLSQRVTDAGCNNDVVYSVIADGQQDATEVVGAWFRPSDQSSSSVDLGATEVGFAKAENLVSSSHELFGPDLQLPQDELSDTNHLASCLAAASGIGCFPHCAALFDLYEDG